MNLYKFIGKRCATCKHVGCKYDGNGVFEVYCKHPHNTRETNYKYATECRGDSLNEYTHWEPDCDMEETNQSIKADAGKPQLTLVPRQILFDIAKVRAFDVKKYGDPDNWKKVEIQRYRDAAFRHFMAYLDDTDGTDAESGLSHLAHLACNIAFLCELEKIPFGGASNITDDEAQAIDVEPVKHAYWEEKQDMDGCTYYRCTNCGEGFVFEEGTPKDNLYYYCPNCGAKMDLKEGEST